MKYKWLQEFKTAEELGEELGCQIKSITRGDLVIGQQDDVDGEGKPITVPVTRKGIEIDFGKKPTDEQLARVDLMLPDLRRAGGRTVPSEIAELRARVLALEKKEAGRE